MEMSSFSCTWSTCVGCDFEFHFLLLSSFFSSQDASFAQFVKSDLEVVLIGFSWVERLLGWIGTYLRWSFERTRNQIQNPSISHFGENPIWASDFWILIMKLRSFGLDLLGLPSWCWRGSVPEFWALSEFVWMDFKFWAGLKFGFRTLSVSIAWRRTVRASCLCGASADSASEF